MMNRELLKAGVFRIQKIRAKDFLFLIFLTLLSAVILPLALPNELFKYGLSGLSFICLAPFFIAIIKSPSAGIASICGMIFGLVNSYITYYWLQFFGNYTVYTIGGVMFGFVLYCALLASFLRGLSGISSRFRPLVLAIGWTFYEFLKSSGFLGFPWALLSHAMHGFLPIIQIVDITGVWGLSFIIALFNSLCAEIVIHPPDISIKRFSLKKILLKDWALFNKLKPDYDFNKVSQVLFALSLIILVLVYGTFRLILPVKSEKTVRVVLVQQNRDPWAEGWHNYELSTLQAEALSIAGFTWAGEKKPDIVVWSETSFQSTLSRNRVLSRLESFPGKKPFLPFIRESGCYFLVGAPYAPIDDFLPMNSVVLFSPGAEIIQYYGKQHPVPFVESIPFWEIPFVQYFYTRVIGIHGVWTLGSTPTVFEIPLRGGGTLSFSTPICFEDAFADLCRKFILNGAEMLINLTNVSWSKTESAEIQMYVAAKFRAVENRRVLIRSTNSGVTSIVDAKGRVLKKLPLFTPDHILADVPVMKENSYTFYTLFGDYLPLIFGFIIIGLCIFHTIRIKLFIKNLYKR
ncbi:MAG: apolipoprotein N-acyltransferase [Spirochaetales bacterium]|nr:apolipoprotein N-acyltransferase [Spirochaetales bacterium]